MADNENGGRSTSSSTLDGTASGLSSKIGSQNRLQSSIHLAHGFSDAVLVDQEAILSEIQRIEPTGLILDYSKRRFHRPLVVILGLAGMRPMTIDPDWSTVLGHIQTFNILVVLMIGYALQFIFGYRRDRGFAKHVPTGPEYEFGYYGYQRYYHYKKFIDSGEILFIYVIPALLHLGGFLSAVFVFRVVDNEQLQCLIERVFILSNIPKALVKYFWVYFSCGLLWLICSTTYFVFVVISAETMPENSYISVTTANEETMKILFFVAIFVQDFVQTVIICTYSISCYLLRNYLKFLKGKLLHRELEPLDWMREICEFRKILHHLNTKLSIPVCFLTLLNLSYTFASVVNLLKDIDTCPIKIFSLTLANIIMWIVIGVVPLFQAAALTVTCRATQGCGHLVSIRPFVHRNTSSDELNTVLLYASSLKMNAKLFRMPINIHYLCFFIFCCLIVIFTFGMCLNISIGLY